jgi:hypothetical protein
MPSEVFEAQAALLVRALPYVAAEICLSLIYWTGQKCVISRSLSL